MREKRGFDLWYIFDGSHNSYKNSLCRIKSDENSILKHQECEDSVYRNCFVGSALVDWMVESGETPDRFGAVMLSRELLELGLIKHGNYNCIT